MKWNSPWSVGYPGWHLECSTLCKKFLGETFDIHGGGLDNIFPHHESEIAQSEVANGKHFVNYFMHNNLVTVNGTKMGKSLGNFITLEDLFKEFDPLLVRYFILQFHYRKPVDFSKEAINNIKPQFEKISQILSKIKEISNKNIKNPENIELKSIKDAFENAMDDDFNTPVAISELLRFVKIAPKFIELNDSEIIAQLNFIVKMFEDVLGFDFKCDTMNVSNISNEQKLIELISSVRDKLRIAKNYELSDYIRNELNRLDISISDKKI